MILVQLSLFVETFLIFSLIFYTFISDLPIRLKVVSGLRLATKLYTYVVTTLVGTHIYRRDHRWATLGTDDSSKPAVTQWGATYTASELKGVIGWHVPSEAEEETVVTICKTLIEPKLERLEQMVSEGVDVTEMKQILSALIGFQATVTKFRSFNY